MSKGNDKTKTSKSNTKGVASSYKQAQGKTTPTPIPFAKRLGAK